jgi:hypothetical protein
LAFHSGREADYSPPSSAEVKEWVELYPHSPNTPSWLHTKVSGLASWSENCKWYRSLPLGAVVSQFCKSV